MNRILSGAVLAALLSGGLSGGGAAWAGKPKAAAGINRLYRSGNAALGAGPLVTTSAGTVHLDDAHYTSVRDGALAMMKRYPPANHFYLALGRSPVSMYSFLHALDPAMTTTFPASDLRLGINAAHHPDYFKHFEHYIPEAVLRGERGDIVIFDRSHDHSGSSLALMKPLLEKYLQSKGYKTKVVALGFAAQGPLQAGVEHMPTARFPKIFLYYNGADHDEAVATYLGHHTIGTHDVSSLDKNPEHPGFQSAMSQRIAADKELDERLASDPHLKTVLAQ